MMYQNASTKCLTDRSLRLISSDVEDLVFRYVFPPEFFLGVFGNALNLWILSCHGMRNRANDMVVFVPIMAVGLLNMLLARRLQNHDKLVLQTENSNMQMTMAIQHVGFNRVEGEFKIILISSCFALTQGPSAVMSVWELLIGYSSKDNTIFIFTSIANALVITGKTINFALFCLSSTHFRRKCALIFLRKFPSLSQTSFGRQMSSRMSGKVEFHGSKASLMHRRSVNSIPRGSNRSRNDSKRFHAQLQPLAEASFNSTEEAAANTSSPTT
uniref:G_PROTEIN_RECEP_F1_2 domain-containing protein n=1 Tax=Panagrellus redivivus TaxID=6233 RepID=A0A7E4ZQG5_PANRE